LAKIFSNHNIDPWKNYYKILTWAFCHWFLHLSSWWKSTALKLFGGKSEINTVRLLLLPLRVDDKIDNLSTYLHILIGFIKKSFDRLSTLSLSERDLVRMWRKQKRKFLHEAGNRNNLSAVGTNPHRNLKTRTMRSKIECGGKVPKVWKHPNNTYIEYCGMENLDGKIQFMIW
jgi:hypothetical protein